MSVLLRVLMIFLNEVLSLNAQEYGKAIDVDCNSIPQ